MTTETIPTAIMDTGHTNATGEAFLLLTVIDATDDTRDDSRKVIPTDIREIVTS